MMIELLTDLWGLVIGPLMPDYILKAINWVSLVFLIILVLSPAIVAFTVMWLARKVGKYD